jgi:flagellar biosynthesis protein FlhA
MSGCSIAMNPGSVSEVLNGIETKEPVFGLSALWISEKNRDRAQISGYTVVDHPTIIATHLSEIIRRHAHELMGRQELQSLVDNVAKSAPKVVEDLIPKICPLGTVLKVCQNLLKEQVPIRDLTTILETMANHADKTQDAESLTELCRCALARTITHRLSQGAGTLEVVNLSPRTEQQILKSYQKTERGASLNLDPGYFEKFVLELNRTLESTVFESGNPCLLVQPLIRSTLKRLLERFIPGLHVVSANEIATLGKVRSLATVDV